MVKNIESTCFGRLYEVAKNIESTCLVGYIMWRKTSSQPVFGYGYIKSRKTSSQRVLVGYIKWRKHRVNAFW